MSKKRNLDAFFKPENKQLKPEESKEEENMQVFSFLKI